MTSALHIARSGLDALDEKMRAISNNLANVNTIGFKKDRANFETLMYQSARKPGDPSAADGRYAIGLGTGTGVRVAGTERIHQLRHNPILQIEDLVERTVRLGIRQALRRRRVDHARRDA